MKIGIVGTGKQARRWHATATSFPGVKVEMANTSGKTDLPVKCYSDAHELISTQPDGLIIAADPLLHVNLCRAADFMEVPVLLEKPAGLYLTDVNKLCSLRTPILVNYTHLFNPGFHDLKENVKQKKIIQMVALNFQMGPWRHFSSLYDYAPHDLSMGLDLAPGTYKVKEKDIKQIGQGMLFRFQLANENNVKLDVLCGNGGDRKERKLLVICSDQSRYIYDDSKAPFGNHPMINAFKAFQQTIKDKKSPVSMDLTQQIHKILYKLGEE